MALLDEYALTPDVFDVASYTNEEVCGLHMQTLKDVLLHEGLVRNLRDGEWARLFSGDHRPWHRRVKELLKKLAKQNRLASFSAFGATAPVSDSEWCDEALATHRQVPLYGIIVTDQIAATYSGEAVVAPVHRLPTTGWWSNRSSSVCLGRTLASYTTALGLVLRHANSILFIDPHLDPSQPRYSDFCTLLQAAGNRTPAPVIEVHRVCYRGSGAARQILNPVDIEADFRCQIGGPAQAAGLSIDVFIWDDFHYRFVISDLVGILVENGFDTTTAPNATTVWARLGRDDRDNIQREFDPASKRHTLRGRFQIP